MHCHCCTPHATTIMLHMPPLLHPRHPYHPVHHTPTAASIVPHCCTPTIMSITPLPSCPMCPHLAIASFAPSPVTPSPVTPSPVTPSPVVPYVLSPIAPHVPLPVAPHTPSSIVPHIPSRILYLPPPLCPMCPYCHIHHTPTVMCPLRHVCLYLPCLCKPGIYQDRWCHSGQP